MFIALPFSSQPSESAVLIIAWSGPSCSSWVLLHTCFAYLVHLQVGRDRSFSGEFRPVYGYHCNIIIEQRRAGLAAGCKQGPELLPALSIGRRSISSMDQGGGKRRPGIFVLI